MEEFLIGLVGHDWAIIAIPVITGVVASFIIKMIDLTTPTLFNSRFWLLLICVVLGILSSFLFPTIITKMRDFVAVSVMNIAFSFLLYNYGGKKLVDTLMTKAVDKISKKVQ